MDNKYTDAHLFNICRESAKWLPPVTERDKKLLEIFIDSFSDKEEKFTTTMVKKYVENIYPYIEILGLSDGDSPRESDCAASGIVFYYTCLFYIMHFRNWGYHIEDILLYNILYILVDHYIDDINVGSEKKTAVIEQMRKLVDNPKCHEEMKLIDPSLKVIAIVYDRLLTRCPNIKKHILNLFESEIEGLIIQNNHSLDEKTYYGIAEKKGGHTVLVLQAIMNKSDDRTNNASFNLGKIIQLIDDSQDVDVDSKNNISTIATHQFKSFGNIDNLWIHIVENITALDPMFNIFKILLMFVMMYLPDKNPHLYSAKLRQATNKYNLFAKFTGKKSVDSLLVKTVSSHINNKTAMR